MGHLDGRCLCGGITYTCSAPEPVLTAICHCADCQRSSGSAFSVVVGVPHDSLHFTGDEPKVYDTMGEDRGELAHRSFCGTCGSPIMSTLDDMPGLALLKAGTLDDASWLQPGLEVWTGSAQPWALTADRDDGARFTRGLPAA
jgi:hypothetical protein